MVKQTGRKELMKILMEQNIQRDVGISYNEFAQLTARLGYTNPQHISLQKLFIFRSGRVLPRSFFFLNCSRYFGGVPVEKSLPENHSFGIEFEGSSIHNTSQVRSSYSPFSRIGGWNMQNDCTVEFEIMTPVLQNVESAKEAIKSQWKRWMADNENFAPYWKCSLRYASVGHHVHVGKPSSRLTIIAKKKLANSVLPILPMIYFIGANNETTTINGNVCLSKRILGSSYCNPISEETLSVADSKYYEVSSSAEYGTVEFRGLDANFPQVTSTCAFLIKYTADKHAKKTKALDNEENLQLVKSFVSKKKALIGRNDIIAFIGLREKMAKYIGDYVPKNYERDVIYLALSCAETPARLIKPKDYYSVSKKMCLSPDTFIENLELQKGVKKSIKKDMLKKVSLRDFCTGKIRIIRKKRFLEIWNQLQDEKVLRGHFTFDEKWFITKDNVRARARRLHFQRFTENTNNEMTEIERANLFVANDFVANRDEIYSDNDRFYVVTDGYTVVALARVHWTARKIKRFVILSGDVARIRKILERHLQGFSMEGV